MKIGITGASGFIGSNLIAEAITNNHQVIGFSRSPDKNIGGCEEVRAMSGDTTPDLSGGLDAIVHLAGESILGVWTAEKKRRILESRISSTQQILDGFFKLDPKDRPKVLACASGVSLYGDRADEWLDEDADAGFGFLSDVVRQWETLALKAEDMGVRVVLLRIGFVVGRTGGAIPVMRNVFNKGLGGNLGSGKQWMPWVHVDDVARIIMTCIENTAIRGAVNVASPNPVTNAELTQVLANKLGKKAFIPAPSFALKALPGGMQEVFLSSLRIEPTVLKTHGFKWEFDTIESAIEEALS